jgi:hypothetical protein
MNKTIKMLATTFTVTLMCAGIALAQVPAQVRPVQDSAAFRQEMSTYFDELEAVATTLRNNVVTRDLLSARGLDPYVSVQAARSAVAAMSDQDLMKMRMYMEQASPQWRMLPSQLRVGALPKIERIAAAIEAKRQAAGSAGAPPARTNLIPDVACSDSLNDGTAVSVADVSVAKGIVIAVSAVMEGFPTDGLTILARIPAIAANAVAEGVELTAEAFFDLQDKCSGNTFEDGVNTSLSTITSTTNSINTTVGDIKTTVNQTASNITDIQNQLNDKLDVKVSSRSTQTSVNTVQGSVNTALTNIAIVNGKVDDLLVKLQSLRDLEIRLQIEQNLSQPNEPIGIFSLPQAQGGYLELVRTIVLDTMAKVIASGEGTSNADTFVAKADADRAAGKFKSAYDGYRKAYRAAVK